MTLRSMLPNFWIPNAPAVREPLMALRRDIDRMIEGFGDQMPSMVWPDAGFVPRLDVTRVDHELEIRAELPGVEMADVAVSVDGETLTIQGEKKTEKKDAEHQLYECSYGSFARSVRLPVAAKAEDLDATFKNGVLTVRVKIPAEARPAGQKIVIKSAA